MVKQSTTINTRTQYTIEYDDECDYFTVSWEDDEELTWIDNENKEYIIDMEEELHGNIGSKFNNTWIEHIKLHFNWKKGEVIYLNTKCNCDNCFYVMRGWGDAGEREEDKKMLITLLMNMDMYRGGGEGEGGKRCTPRKQHQRKGACEGEAGGGEGEEGAGWEAKRRGGGGRESRNHAGWCRGRGGVCDVACRGGCGQGR